MLTTFSDPGGISGLSVADIIGNGFDGYYDSSLAADSPLNGQTYSLAKGGRLPPK